MIPSRREAVPPHPVTPRTRHPGVLTPHPSQPHLQRRQHMLGRVHRTHRGAAEHAHAVGLHAVVRQLSAELRAQRGGLCLPQRR